VAQAQHGIQVAQQQRAWAGHTLSCSTAWRQSGGLCELPRCARAGQQPQCSVRHVQRPSPSMSEKGVNAHRL
jgi:hypothetical protein